MRIGLTKEVYYRFISWQIASMKDGDPDINTTVFSDPLIAFIVAISPDRYTKADAQFYDRSAYEPRKSCFLVLVHEDSTLSLEGVQERYAEWLESIGYRK